MKCCLWCRPAAGGLSGERGAGCIGTTFGDPESEVIGSGAPVVNA